MEKKEARHILRKTGIKILTLDEERMTIRNSFINQINTPIAKNLGSAMVVLYIILPTFYFVMSWSFLDSIVGIVYFVLFGVLLCIGLNNVVKTIRFMTKNIVTFDRLKGTIVFFKDLDETPTEVPFSECSIKPKRNVRYSEKGIALQTLECLCINTKDGHEIIKLEWQIAKDKSTQILSPSLNRDANGKHKALYYYPHDLKKLQDIQAFFRTYMDNTKPLA